MGAEGPEIYGSYPDIDAMFDRPHIWQLVLLNGAGPRIDRSGLGLIAGTLYWTPYEDVTLAVK
jgi:hypothetical protein